MEEEKIFSSYNLQVNTPLYFQEKVRRKSNNISYSIDDNNQSDCFIRTMKISKSPLLHIKNDNFFDFGVELVLFFLF